MEIDIAVEIQKVAEPTGTNKGLAGTCRGGFLVPDPDYHRRQAAIFTRLSETARDPDTAAAFLWLATEHRAKVELTERPTQPTAAASRA